MQEDALVKSMLLALSDHLTAIWDGAQRCWVCRLAGFEPPIEVVGPTRLEATSRGLAVALEMVGADAKRLEKERAHRVAVEIGNYYAENKVVGADGMTLQEIVDVHPAAEHESPEFRALVAGDLEKLGILRGR